MVSEIRSRGLKLPDLVSCGHMYGHPEFDLFEAIYTTRAMRRLMPDPVPREIILKIIEAATMAPSNSNRQPWIFVVVTAAETRQFVAQRYKQAWETYYLTAEKRQFLATQPDTPEAKNLRSASYLANHLRRGAGHASAVINIMSTCRLPRLSIDGQYL